MRILLIAIFVYIASCMPKGDEVTSLPGWNENNGTLHSKWWAGFTPAGSDKVNNVTYDWTYHYVFVESENDPATDPVVVWTNGGPGAASYFGLMTEVGPYSLSDESFKTADYNKTKIPTLFRNKFSWTKMANLLIINGPAPVGYSYCSP